LGREGKAEAREHWERGFRRRGTACLKKLEVYASPASYSLITLSLPPPLLSSPPSSTLGTGNEGCDKQRSRIMSQLKLQQVRRREGRHTRLRAVRVESLLYFIMLESTSSAEAPHEIAAFLISVLVIWCCTRHGWGAPSVPCSAPHPPFHLPAALVKCCHRKWFFIETGQAVIMTIKSWETTPSPPHGDCRL
jgi:hypothetical protein